MLTPTAGHVHVLGIEGRRSVHRLARRGPGFVPSERGLFAALTVGDNIRIRTGDRGGPVPAAERRTQGPQHPGSRTAHR